MTEADRPSPDIFGAEPASAVDLEDVEGSVRLIVRGPLDLHSAPRPRAMIDRATRQRPAAVIVDLCEVSFLASAGMAELVRAHRAAPRDVPVRVVATGRLVMRPLELTRLTDELEIHPSLAAALAAGALR